MPTTQDEIREYASKALRTRIRKLKACVERARSERNAEALHDLRVASRRLRAAIQVLAPLFEPNELKTLDKTAKGITKLLGKARDIDVSAELATRQASLLADEERPLLDAYVEKLASDRGALSMRLQGKLAKVSLEIEPALAESGQIDLTRAVGEPIKAVLSYVQDHRNSQDLHEMRIALKRLRYRIEVLEPLIKVSVEPLKPLQDHLGQIHDIDVLVPKLMKKMHKHLLKEPESLAPATGILVCSRHLLDERKALHAAFLQGWSALKQSQYLETLEKAVAQASEA